MARDRQTAKLNIKGKYVTLKNSDINECLVNYPIKVIKGYVHCKSVKYYYTCLIVERQIGLYFLIDVKT